MIALLLASLAHAEPLPAPAPDDGAVYARLFGAQDESAAPPVAAEPEPSPWRLVGPAALLFAGAGATWFLKRRAASPAAQAITILSRQALGDRSALVLVEVVDADGEKRRLLLGTGGGPPSLVTDLGSSVPTPQETPANIAAQVLAERRGAPAEGGFQREATRRGLP